MEVKFTRSRGLEEHKERITTEIAGMGRDENMPRSMHPRRASTKQAPSAGYRRRLWSTLREFVVIRATNPGPACN